MYIHECATFIVLYIAVTKDCSPTNDSNNTTSLSQSPQHSCPPGFPHWWQGIAFFLQNLFIFLRLVTKVHFYMYMYVLHVCASLCMYM